MDEIGIAGDQHVGTDVGVRMGDLDAVGGHLDIDAVLDAAGTHAVGVGGAGRWEPGGHEHRFDAGGVEGGRVVEKLAGAPKFGGPGNPVRVSLGNHYASVVGDFFFQSGNVRGAVAYGQTDLEVFPVDEQGDVRPAVEMVLHAVIRPGGRFQAHLCVSLPV